MGYESMRLAALRVQRAGTTGACDNDLFGQQPSKATQLVDLLGLDRHEWRAVPLPGKAASNTERRRWDSRNGATSPTR